MYIPVKYQATDNNWYSGHIREITGSCISLLLTDEALPYYIPRYLTVDNLQKVRM